MKEHGRSGFIGDPVGVAIGFENPGVRRCRVIVEDVHAIVTLTLSLELQPRSSPKHLCSAAIVVSHLLSRKLVSHATCLSARVLVYAGLRLDTSGARG
jgi:hypothetical protein